MRSESAFLHHLASPSGSIITSSVDQLLSSKELRVIDLATIRAATNEFSDVNKLGQGGFGTVFKVLPFSLIHCGSIDASYRHK